jgi:hypothetical protein
MQLMPILSILREVHIYIYIYIYIDISAKDEVEWLPSEMRSILYLLLWNII